MFQVLDEAMAVTAAAAASQGQGAGAGGTRQRDSVPSSVLQALPDIPDSVLGWCVCVTARGGCVRLCVCMRTHVYVCVRVRLVVVFCVRVSLSK